MLLLQFALGALLLSPAASYADIYGPTGPTPLVTGNGFGLAVYSLEKKALTKFYAHPYRFETPDPQNNLSEGIETANFLTSLTWERDTNGQAAYLKQSHIVAVEKANARQYFFMPFGLPHNALVAVTKNDAGCLQPAWANPLLGETQEERGFVFRFQGIKERILAYPLGRSQNPRYSNHCLKGARGWALLSLEAGEDSRAALEQLRTWAGASSALSLVQKEFDEFEKWRVAPKIELQSKEERKLWRQQETILRMAQSREPNRANRFSNGMIVASLPEGMWFVTWVRDMAYATLALLRMGHQMEARAALASYFNAQPTGLQQNDVRGFPYQISVVRYFGNGAEEPFFTMEGATNIEFDNWGLVLMVLSEYVAKYHDFSFLGSPTWRGENIYEVARDYIAKPLVGNLDPYGSGKIVSADTSAWEEYQ
ncbi:MAG: glycoside hydrolase family 15, partial [Bdellovibrionota bacterium]